MLFPPIVLYKQIDPHLQHVARLNKELCDPEATQGGEIGRRQILGSLESFLAAPDLLDDFENLNIDQKLLEFCAMLNRRESEDCSSYMSALIDDTNTFPESCVTSQGKRAFKRIAWRAKVLHQLLTIKGVDLYHLWPTEGYASEDFIDRLEEFGERRSIVESGCLALFMYFIRWYPRREKIEYVLKNQHMLDKICEMSCQMYSIDSAAAFAHGDDKSVESVMKHCILIAMNDSEASATLAEAKELLWEVLSCLVRVRELVQQKPGQCKDTALALGKGKRCEEDGHLDEAYEWYMRVLSLDDDNSIAREKLITILIQRKPEDAFRKVFGHLEELARREARDSLEKLLIKCFFAFESGRDELTDRFDEYRSNKEVLNAIGEKFKATKQYDKAIAWFERARLINDNGIVALVHLLEIFFDSNEQQAHELINGLNDKQRREIAWHFMIAEDYTTTWEIVKDLSDKPSENRSYLNSMLQVAQNKGVTWLVDNIRPRLGRH